MERKIVGDNKQRMENRRRMLATVAGNRCRQNLCTLELWQGDVKTKGLQDLDDRTRGISFAESDALCRMAAKGAAIFIGGSVFRQPAGRDRTKRVRFRVMETHFFIGLAIANR